MGPQVPCPFRLYRLHRRAPYGQKKGTEPLWRADRAWQPGLVSKRALSPSFLMLDGPRPPMAHAAPLMSVAAASEPQVEALLRQSIRAQARTLTRYGTILQAMQEIPLDN